jgi:hypothetical protein
MSLKSFGFLCMLLIFGLGCYQESHFEEQDLGPEEDSDEIVTPPPPDSTPDPPKESPSVPDEGFDPCPSDTYTLLDADGLEYKVEIQVFCEPTIVHNLGCPGPGF